MLSHDNIGPNLCPSFTLHPTCVSSSESSLIAAAPPPKNVIHFIDDLGYRDIGPFGAVKQKTPHLDRMT